MLNNFFLFSIPNSEPSRRPGGATLRGRFDVFREPKAKVWAGYNTEHASSSEMEIEQG
jgi:hypothetical protein